MYTDVNNFRKIKHTKTRVTYKENIIAHICKSLHTPLPFVDAPRSSLSYGSKGTKYPNNNKKKQNRNSRWYKYFSTIQSH